jgi:hypothetical protein
MSDLDSAGSVNNWPLESVSVSQDYGSADPNQKEIFTDPQHFLCIWKSHLEIYVNLMVSDFNFGLMARQVLGGCLTTGHAFKLSIGIVLM